MCGHARAMLTEGLDSLRPAIFQNGEIGSG